LLGSFGPDACRSAASATFPEVTARFTISLRRSPICCYQLTCTWFSGSANELYLTFPDLLTKTENVHEWETKSLVEYRDGGIARLESGLPVGLAVPPRGLSRLIVVMMVAAATK
jgi:hypothetical protein